jgi:protein-disulfide isomerase
MRTNLTIVLIASLTLITIHTKAQTTAAGSTKTPSKRAPSSSTPKQGVLENRVEKYLRNLYAWGPEFEVKIGPAKPSPVPDLLEAPVTVSSRGQSNNAVVYVSEDGTYLIRGELENMNADPYAEIRSKLQLASSPSIGPENAKVTLVEFADFECPVCRQLDLILRQFLPTHPEVRLVYKNFPLTEIHPWAMTAAIASQCAYQQNPATFWKMHDAIFDAQEVISPSNVWEKMADLASQQGLDADTFKTCMASPEAEKQVEATISQGHAVNVTGTPTTFLNGRRLVGADESTLKELDQFEQVK